jgi:uncharacterized protein YbaA (DUF1428 family)
MVIDRRNKKIRLNIRFGVKRLIWSGFERLVEARAKD